MNDEKQIQELKDESNKYKNNMPFYLLTLEVNNGESKQIKIYPNSDPFELSYNFCKENNLDFESMKYVKKNIKEIVKKFNKDDRYIMVEEEYYEAENEDEDEDEYKKNINHNEGKNSKNKKSTNELICNLVKKNIKLNHSKINSIAPLQKKINEDIQKIYKLKKNELYTSPNSTKRNKKNVILRNNNYHLLKNSNIFRENKTSESKEAKNQRYKFSTRNSNEKKGSKIFLDKNESCEYGVPELKKNNSINMIKYTSIFSENNNSIKSKQENDAIKSDSRKYENEDDCEEDKHSSKEDKKKEIKNSKISENKEKEKKFNCFYFNKMINNNNYNHNYYVNNNNSINIKNNNIINDMNPLKYICEYQFNYTNSKDSMEDDFNNKSFGKRSKKSNRIIRRISNDKFKGSLGFNSKTNSKKKINSNLYSTEYKSIMNICKKIKKNKKKNIISIDNNKSSESNYSQEIRKTLLNDYKNSVSKNKKKKIKQINLNKAAIFNKLKGFNTIEETSLKKIRFNNKSLKKILFDTSLKAESVKNDSKIIFNQEEISKSIRYSSKNNICPFINISKEIKPKVGITHPNKTIKSKDKKNNLANNYPKNIKNSNDNLNKKLSYRSTNTKIDNDKKAKNFHLINYKSKFIEFNTFQKNNSNLYNPLNSHQFSKFKNTSYISDRKYINKSFLNNTTTKKDINQQILINMLNNVLKFYMIERSKFIDISKSFSKIIKIFPPEIKNIYIKMLDYLNNNRAGKLYKIINKNTFVNEMINAYNIILTKKEQNILLKANKNIL